MTTTTSRSGRVLTIENDSTSLDLRRQLERIPQMDDAELYRVRDDAANGYMLYAIKPLPENSNQTPFAKAIRVQRTRLYREVWLATWDEGLNR